ncbi:abortive infection family protein [Brevibacillus centrosporus]|uniref:abortive infection family protein n=1 Tax=Brevibacillus centrosporus TaxID=54910 RepID=UPI0011412E88|nr:abortive infection family protein [Brevibacillus centrosporus]MEC2129315.1 abortive infection family protein [Brevibacillus centrosporus]GED33481.1 hypothetical protein BCE02nite_46220 [Brevibacillus centrosporus]
MKQLSKFEVNSVVSYIGVSGGYLGNFSYPSHADFYPSYCGLDIDPSGLSGTTRERFISILSSQDGRDQAKILRGVIEKFPLSYFEDQLEGEIITKNEMSRKRELHEKILRWIDELSDNDLVILDDLTYDFDFVRQALDQCETLITAHSYSSAVDRAHTALHGYLKEQCKLAQLEITETNPKIQDYWSKMKLEHPKFSVDVKEHQKPINHIVNAISKVLDNVNEIRNKRTFSHPNDEVLDEEEARLVINLARAILQYVDNKVSR